MLITSHSLYVNNYPFAFHKKATNVNIGIQSCVITGEHRDTLREIF